MSFILAIDQSTAGTKALLSDEQGFITAKDSINHKQYYPAPGWVEHDAEEIWQNVVKLISRLPEQAGVSLDEINGIAISNQRETTVAWDRATGKPLAPAVVWQCQRGAGICENLSEHGEMIRARTGLQLSAYYPAAKAAWLLQHVPGLKQKALTGDACIGTVDAYLVFRLTGGESFKTDYSNASRTQLFNLHTLTWDHEICELFDIPLSCLPQIEFSDAVFGNTLEKLFGRRLPIAGVMGDSHAALFGQGCLKPGMAKATYGTGSSIMLNNGSSYAKPPVGIAASLAWGWRGEINYVLEGNVTSSGDTLNWLINELELVSSPQEIDELAEGISSTEGVYLVPAFSGLGAPYFDSDARGAIVGMSRGCTRRHISRAALESIAYQNHAVVEAMGVSIAELRVDGGPTRSTVLMQFQSDLLGCPVRCSIAQEISALGAAYMCGLTLGFFKNQESIAAWQQSGKVYRPSLTREQSENLTDGWKEAVRRVMLK
jgi:glycerol kinase